VVASTMDAKTSFVELVLLETHACKEFANLVLDALNSQHVSTVNANASTDIKVMDSLVNLSLRFHPEELTLGLPYLDLFPPGPELELISSTVIPEYPEFSSPNQEQE